MDAETAGVTTGLVQTERRGAVFVLRMAAAPVNALGPELRRDLQAALAQAAGDAAARAVVIGSALSMFSAGLPQRPVKSDAPSLADLCLMIEAMAKPVVVALDGAVLGGGMDLALAAHARVANEAARLGCPEVSLGRVPEAGATQRLPRLIGAEAAFRLLLEPQPVTAPAALAMGLVDLVVPGDALAAACDLAADLAGELAGRPPFPTSARRDGFRDLRGYQAAVAAARGKHDLPHLPAAGRAIDCVEAALLLPLEQGLIFEAQAHADLADTPVAAALLHAQQAEQRAFALPRALAGQAMPDIAALAIWGGGDVAGDVAVQALGRGMRVVVVEPARDLLVKTVEKIAARQDLAVTEGRLSEPAREADWARLGSTLSASGLAGADLILLAPEAGPLPEGISGPVLPLGALPTRAVAGKAALHPAAAAGLVAEISQTEAADPALLRAGVALAQKLGWRVLHSGPGGPLDRRLRAALTAAIAGLEQAGHPRDAITAALASFGIGAAPRRALPKPPPKAEAMLEACLAALANEGARLLQDGVARRAGDVDAAAVHAGLFPRWQGGPLFWADQRGLLVLRADLRHRAATAPALYTPDPLFDRLIAEGLHFADL